MIEIRDLCKSFKFQNVLNNINLKINKGEIFVLVGASGCGKTTILKMINKLETPTSGDILINGESIYIKDTVKLRRGIGYVIQQTGLFPHMTVRENIELVSKLEGKSQDDLYNKTIELLNMVGLDPYEYMDRYPSELSGGQQQRVGVARAFALDADVILMDEPFSALDPITRSELQDQLFFIQQELKKTIIFVTHDMDEAIKLASRMCILKEGKILQIGTPYDILRNPQSSYVEDFVGQNRFWAEPELIKARDIMITGVVKGSLNYTVLQAIDIMRGKKVDTLVITDKNSTYIGMVTLKELKGIFNKELFIKDIVIKDIEAIDSSEILTNIINKFNSNKIGCLPVIQDNKIQGLITKSTLLSVLANQLDEGGNLNELN
ncbi:MAG: ABC transporter ATP-binding protein [Clostridium sp.]|uniref:ABC transporter ATP-binding protein n=1 Tax=Clostridium sp. TaxID=1506 RepID=UPI002FC6FABE